MLATGLQLAVLGAGDAEFEHRLQEAHIANPGQVAFCRGMNEGLAYRLQSGADLLLMPSRYEPCGLNQMYSIRYGTVPVVRRTGGPGDTVDAAAGFTFDEPSAAALIRAVTEALNAYGDPALWRELQQTGMRRDFSWNRSAAAYERVYGALCERNAP